MTHSSDRETDRGTTGGEQPPVVIRDKRKVDQFGDRPRAVPGADGGPAPAHAAAEPPVLSVPPVAPESPESDAERQLTERTADLQRLQAEYANYRKRVDRDRLVVGEVATARVLEALLPVLDDIDRAEAHGDVSGAFKSVADQFGTALQKLGLESFGVEGDPFDPAVHEAVMHDERADIAEPTATTVMRRGYRVGERLLRPAMVGVSDPAVTVSEMETAPDAERETGPETEPEIVSED